MNCDLKKQRISTYNECKWTEFALLIDFETDLDPRNQALVFGFYRVCKLQGDKYTCVEEGLVHADSLDKDQLRILRYYARTHASEVISDQYDERIHVYDRSEFVEKVFFEAVRNRAFVVAFAAPWDISRLGVDHKISRNRGWTLILSQRTSRKTGKLEPNPERPFVRATSKDSKACFFSLTKPRHPEEWPHYETMRKGDEKPQLCNLCRQPATHRSPDETALCADHAKEMKKSGQKVRRIKRLRLIFRVLDLRTLGWALFNESYSLRSICDNENGPFRGQNLQQKLDHEPTGKVTIDEIEYARQDVRCTVDVLNALKSEFDRHPIDLHPDKAVSPASVGKAILRAMGIVPPAQKFEVPDYINGIASQAYFGGQAEIRLRQTPLPCVLTDFRSQYPVINSLLGNPEILAAERLSFPEATAEVQEFVERTTREDCRKPDCWKKMRFFALVKPDNDVFPVRAEYNEAGVTKNIGVNHFTSDEACWMSGPDVIASKLLTGKSPLILKAIRIVPHGIQEGLTATNLRGMVSVDPQTQDLFRVMVEQKQVYKDSNPDLSYFLKICANATSYGIWFELTPQKRFNSVKVKVFSVQKLCHEASAAEEKFVIIIDEINRGNISRIFGELLLLLEYRDLRVELPYEKDGQLFSIPSNVYLIGTMNTTDRSLAQIDYALRRRFYFYRLLPVSNGRAPVLEGWLAAQSNFTADERDEVLTLFLNLNARIRQELGEHFQVGTAIS